MNKSSAPVEYGVDEFVLAGLTAVPGRVVDAPYVGEAFAALECRVTEILRPKDIDGNPSSSYMVIGQVMGIHLSEDVLRDGRIDMALARPIGRMGYMDYADGGAEVFEMFRPTV
jgi:flavin reductase (DIM6/NTAB) family NADH-FMN oxidoreductase RutF